MARATSNPQAWKIFKKDPRNHTGGRRGMEDMGRHSKSHTGCLGGTPQEWWLRWEHTLSKCNPQSGSQVNESVKKDGKRNAKDLTVWRVLSTDIPNTSVSYCWNLAYVCAVWCRQEYSNNKWQRLTEAKSWKAMLILLTYGVHKA